MLGGKRSGKLGGKMRRCVSSTPQTSEKVGGWVSWVVRGAVS